MKLHRREIIAGASIGGIGSVLYNRGLLPFQETQPIAETTEEHQLDPNSYQLIPLKNKPEYERLDITFEVNSGYVQAAAPGHEVEVSADETRTISVELSRSRDRLLLDTHETEDVTNLRITIEVFGSLGRGLIEQLRR